MNRVYRHPGPVNVFTGQPMGGGCIEYFLPVDRSQVPLESPMPPDFEGLADLERESASNRFSTRYSVARTEPVRTLALRLSAFQVFSLLLCDGDWYLRLCLDIGSYSAGNNFYLRPSLDQEKIDGLFEEFDFGDETFREFVELFGGIREAIPPMAGAFAYDDFKLFRENRWSKGVDRNENKEWLNSLCLYTARNGDILLMNRSGGTAWFLHEESRIEKYSNSFPEFLAKYTAFNVNYEQVFDAYSAFKPNRSRGK